MSEPRSSSKSAIESSNVQSSSSSNYQQQQHVNHANVPPQSSLFISNLTWWTSEDDLRGLLGDLSARIKELQFLENKPNGKSKGIVIIEFVDVATAEAAKSLLDRKEIHGRVIDVNFARSPPVKPYDRSSRKAHSGGFNKLILLVNKVERAEHRAEYRDGHQRIEYQPHKRPSNSHSHVQSSQYPQYQEHQQQYYESDRRSIQYDHSESRNSSLSSSGRNVSRPRSRSPDNRRRRY